MTRRLVIRQQSGSRVRPVGREIRQQLIAEGAASVDILFPSKTGAIRKEGGRDGIALTPADAQGLSEALQVRAPGENAPRYARVTHVVCPDTHEFEALDSIESRRLFTEVLDATNGVLGQKEIALALVLNNREQHEVSREQPGEKSTG